MLHSMTGYGCGAAEIPGGRVTVELRSLNHRYGEVVIRLPRELSPLEDRVRALVKSRVHRGRVEVFLKLDLTMSGRCVRVDRPLILSYYQALKELQELLQLPDPPGLGELLAVPALVSVCEQDIDLEGIWPGVESAVGQGLGALCAMRQREGAVLCAELAKRFDDIAGLVQEAAGLASTVVEHYRQKLQQRLEAWLGGLALDEQRLAMEVALLADRSSIAEELTRIGSHLDQCRIALESPEPVGRRLEFLAQELHREVNTIASKSADVTLSRLVVELKSEVEKVREEVQNVQ
ncbi:MAG TPA: YicC family protein [Clostridiales bacterium UBA8153]|nr:YicC family protein [Clostridiales bacterium UBA8153]